MQAFEKAFKITNATELDQRVIVISFYSTYDNMS